MADKSTQQQTKKRRESAPNQIVSLLPIKMRARQPEPGAPKFWVRALAEA